VIETIQSIIGLLAIIGLGYGLTASGWFDDRSMKLVARLVTSVALPAYTLTNLLSSMNRDVFARAGFGMLIPFAVVLTAYGAGWLVSLALRVEPARRGVFRAVFAFVNSIYLGLPVNVAIFGEPAVPYVLLYYLANTSIFWTLGAWGIKRDGGQTGGSLFSLRSLRQVFSITLAAFAVAVALVLLEIRLPRFVMDSARYIGGMTTPLSLMYIGYVIRSMDTSKIRMNTELVVVLAGRFCLLPALAFLIGGFFGIPPLMRQVFIIEAAMPVMTQPAIVARAYGADDHYAALVISVTTAASIVVIPLYMFGFALLG
jgi:predicted permease